MEEHLRKVNEVGKIVGKYQMLRDFVAIIGNAAEEMQNEQNYDINDLFMKLDYLIDIETLKLDEDYSSEIKEMVDNPGKYHLTDKHVKALKEFANPVVKDTRRGTSFTVIKGGKD